MGSCEEQAEQSAAEQNKMAKTDGVQNSEDQWVTNEDLKAAWVRRKSYNEFIMHVCTESKNQR